MESNYSSHTPMSGRQIVMPDNYQLSDLQVHPLAAPFRSLLKFVQVALTPELPEVLRNLLPLSDFQAEWVRFVRPRPAPLVPR